MGSTCKWLTDRVWWNGTYFIGMSISNAISFSGSGKPRYYRIVLPPELPSSICLRIFLPEAVRERKFSLSVSISNCRSWNRENNKNQDTRPPMDPLTILKNFIDAHSSLPVLWYSVLNLNRPLFGQKKIFICVATKLYLELAKQ